MTKSKEMAKMGQKFYFEREPNKQCFFQHNMLLDHCYVFGLLLKSSGLKKKIFKSGAPLPSIFDCFGSTMGISCKKKNNTCKGL